MPTPTPNVATQAPVPTPAPVVATQAPLPTPTPVVATEAPAPELTFAVETPSPESDTPAPASGSEGGLSDLGAEPVVEVGQHAPTCSSLEITRISQRRNALSSSRSDRAGKRSINALRKRNTLLRMEVTASRKINPRKLGSQVSVGDVTQKNTNDRYFATGFGQLLGCSLVVWTLDSVHTHGSVWHLA